MGKITGFMEYQRLKEASEAPKKRLKHYKEFLVPLDDKGIKVHERHIMPTELEGFQQCWLTGTAAEVTPVGQIGDYNFEVGALTQQISTDYEKMVRK